MEQTEPGGPEREPGLRHHRRGETEEYLQKTEHSDSAEGERPRAEKAEPVEDQHRRRDKPEDAVKEEEDAQDPADQNGDGERQDERPDHATLGDSPLPPHQP